MIYSTWKIVHAEISLASVAAIFAALLSAGPASAQTQRVQADLRYETLRDTPDRNKTTPGNKFGEQHSLESGALSFWVVDVDIPGNSPLEVQFSRSLQVEDVVVDQNGAVPNSSRLGDWDVALPRIQATYDFQAGWITSDSSRPSKNCSVTQKTQLSPPPGFYFPAEFPPHRFWNPPTLIFPGRSSTILVYNEGIVDAPTAGGPYYWLTSSFDYASCLATLKNPPGANPEELRFGASEGYLITRADGTKYWFDWVALDKTTPTFTTRAVSGGTQWYLETLYLKQARLALYPTRVEDRNGNWVTYTYSNKTNQPVKLDKIESNDGRRIDIGYVDGYLDSVTSNGRVWKYSYVLQGRIKMLSEVRNPDQSTWQYGGRSKPVVDWAINREHGSCFRPEDWIGTQNSDATDASYTLPASPTFTVKSPSGAFADFYTGVAILGRSGVPKDCYTSGQGIVGGLPTWISEFEIPVGGKRIVLIAKKARGAGMADAIWRFNYQSDIGFAPFVGTSRTKILGPDGALTTYVFGNVYQKNEGLLLSSTIYESGEVIRSESFNYALDASDAPFPKRLGYHPYTDSDQYPGTYLRPEKRAVTTQQATRFIREVAMSCGGGSAICLDGYGRAIRIIKSSAPTP